MANLQKDVVLHIQEVNQTPNSIVLKKYVTKHIKMKVLKTKDKKKNIKNT